MNYTRYAIFHTLASGPLASFGTAWLGWDSATGQPVAHPNIPGLPVPIAEATTSPRKYGLHGTVNPPFRLNEDQSELNLKAAFRDFCDTAAPVKLTALDLTRLGRFLALTPVGDTAALSILAADTVRSLDPYRAPLTEAELAHRRAAGLTPSQDALLLQWGYPYVMEAFRFHITLTGKLPKRTAMLLTDTLRPHLLPLIPTPCIIEALSLMGEDQNGNFHVIERCSLSG